MDRRAIAAAVFQRSGIKITEDDPAFLLADINLLMLEQQTSKAAQELAQASVNFQAIATRNIDEFVGVANEALSRFTQKTTELRQAVEAIGSRGAARTTTLTASNAAPTMDHPTPTSTASRGGMVAWWLLPVAFAAGTAVGVLTSFAVLK